MSAMENIERVELGANSLKEVPKLTMNGLNNLFEFGVGEGVMTSVGGIVIGSDSLNSLSSFNFTRFSNVMDIAIGNRSLNIATSVIQLQDNSIDKHEYNHRNKDEDLLFISKYEDYKSRYSVSKKKSKDEEVKIQNLEFNIQNLRFKAVKFLTAFSI